jgi:hypothetical protein
MKVIGLRKVVSNRCKLKRVELEKDVFLCENFATIATNALPASFHLHTKTNAKKRNQISHFIKNYK